LRAAADAVGRGAFHQGTAWTRLFKSVSPVGTVCDGQSTDLSDRALTSGWDLGRAEGARPGLYPAESKPTEGLAGGRAHRDCACGVLVPCVWQGPARVLSSERVRGAAGELGSRRGWGGGGVRSPSMHVRQCAIVDPKLAGINDRVVAGNMSDSRFLSSTPPKTNSLPPEQAKPWSYLGDGALPSTELVRSVQVNLFVSSWLRSFRSPTAPAAMTMIQNVLMCREENYNDLTIGAISAEYKEHIST
jgi:hypothetical protein